MDSHRSHSAWSPRQRSWGRIVRGFAFAPGMWATSLRNSHAWQRGRGRPTPIGIRRRCVTVVGPLLVPARRSCSPLSALMGRRWSSRHCPSATRPDDPPCRQRQLLREAWHGAGPGPSLLRAEVSFAAGVQGEWGGGRRCRLMHMAAQRRRTSPACV